MKILLTDDSSTMRKIERRVLIEMGYTDISEAGNGLEALKILKESPVRFDLVMMDINMPECDGITALRMIRSTPGISDIPVIMCTSVAEKDQVLLALKTGANNYCVKPFKPEDLQKKIQATLGIKPADPAAPAAPAAPATPA